MRRIYLITYDICDAKRLRAVFKCLRNWGDHVQYSVFECQLAPTELLTCKAELAQRIQHDVDQVLVIDLGPVQSRPDDLIQTIGRAYSQVGAACLVV
ncbi:MAG: CRISPR-associated endonuclease Cas2 [Pirellulaceae bacterium]